MSISLLDWIVIATYLVFLLAMATWLSRSQFNREDYYVGGRSLGKWPVAISIMATQCSTNSILGAPAFVALTLASIRISRTISNGGAYSLCYSYFSRFKPG